MKALLFLSLLVFALLGCQNYNQLNSCYESYVQPDWAKLQRDLEQNRQLWQSKNISSYHYTLESSSWIGTFPVDVVVENNWVVLPELKPDQPANELEQYKIESLFENIQGTIQNPKRDACEGLAVEYDPSYGFPAQRGWAIVSPRIADASFTQKVLRFTQK